MKVSVGRLAGALVSCALAAAVFAGCGDDDEGGGGGAASGGGELTKVDIIAPVEDNLLYPWHLLGKTRFYEEEGLEVNWQGTEGSSYVIQQVVAGSAKFGLATASAVMTGAGQGSDMRGIGAIGKGIFVLGVPEDSDVQSVEDLRGKSIGITDTGGAGYNFLLAVLKDAGIDPEKDVELPVVGDSGPGVYDAVKSDKVQAYNGTIADIAALEGAAGGLKFRNILPEEYLNLPGTEFTVPGSVLANEDDKAIAVKLMNAWRKATDYVLENSEQALEEACEHVPEQCQDMVSAQSLWDGALAAMEYESGTFGKHNYDGLQEMLDKVVDQSTLEGPVDVNTAFTDELVGDYN